ncbi:hypothetical protein MKL09_12280 [Methylobacterium sp. J-048]|uniref:hypothetical protein n=1 Tax=Methylobacterium sp. J-048 TaxID=2836635 RepID=UPI001FBAA8A5|nr:hypothetical protein [Methylobacterium sp. J-048]MCJ2057332.1 hypothetical protein [Methylobacterium sp. J-048]
MIRVSAERTNQTPSREKGRFFSDSETVSFSIIRDLRSARRRTATQTLENLRASVIWIPGRPVVDTPAPDGHCRMRCLLVLLGCLIAQAAQAQGFAGHDLTAFTDPVRAAIGRKASVRATPLTLTATCVPCTGSPNVDIQLGISTDGTETRVRTGQTSLAKLEALCIKQNPDCRLSALPVSPAVGWITVYAVGNEGGSTAVILRDGDLLTIRAKADNPGHAEDAVLALTQKIAPKIVGP